MMMAMSNDVTIIIAIVCAALITYTLRLGGLLLAEKMPQSNAFKYFMDALPGTILVALVVPGIVSAGRLGWGAALLTALCAYKTNNVLLSMLVGMIIVSVGRTVF
jgi:uncharacterized membrane protein